MLPARVKFGVLPALILNVIASGGTHPMAEEVQGQAEESAESSGASIAVHWREEGYFMPPPKFTGQADASDPAIRDRFAEGNFPECFRQYATRLHWCDYYHTTLATLNPPFCRCFTSFTSNTHHNSL